MTDVPKAEDIAIRRAAMVARWGTPSEARTYDNPGSSTDVLKWERGKVTQGVTLYVSAGAPAADPNSGHVDEFVLGLHPDAPGAGWVLAALAGLRANNEGRIGNGSVVSFDEPLWPDTDMKNVLIRYSYSDDDRNIPLSDGRHLSLLSVVPIFDHEHDIVRNQGPDALFEEWQARKVRFINPYRLP